MKQLILNNYIIQEVDSDCILRSAKVNGNELEFVLSRESADFEVYKLPPGNYQIVQPSEEVAREIVERMDNNNWPKPVYKNYCPMLDINFFTALESYASLLKANQISNAVILKQI